MEKGAHPLLTRREIVSGGKELLAAAERCRTSSKRSMTDGDVKEEEEEGEEGDEEGRRLIEVVQSEMQVVMTLFQKAGLTILQHPFIQSRAEYLLLIVHHLLKRHPVCICKATVTVVPNLYRFFRLLYQVVHSMHAAFFAGHSSAVEEDVLSVTNTVHSINNPEFFGADDVFDCSEDLPPGRTDWYSMCFTSLTAALVGLLSKCPQSVKHISINLVESMSLISSPLWQIQLFGLMIIHSLLMVEALASRPSIAEPPKSASASTDNSKSMKCGALTGKLPAGVGATTSASAGSSKSRKSSVSNASSGPASASESTRGKGKPPSGSSNKEYVTQSQQSQKQSLLGGSKSTRANSFYMRDVLQTRTSEELFRTGFIRSLAQLMLHRHGSIRTTAHEIFMLLLSISNSSAASEMSKEEDLTDLWSCSIEQGLVPWLECISTGLLIKGDGPMQQDAIFPESIIRRAAGQFLSQVAHHTESSNYIRLRLLNALTHSGNQKLRVNIVMGIFHLCARSPSLGRLLWIGQATSAVRSVVSISFNHGGQHFAAMCSSLLNDSMEFKQLFQLILYIFDVALSLLRDRSETKGSGNEISTQTADSSYVHNGGLSALDVAEQKARESLQPIILVFHVTTWTKMVCPPIDVIRRNGVTLAEKVEISRRGLIDEAVHLYRQKHMNPYDSDPPHDSVAAEKSLRSLLNSLDESLFLRLDGSYSLWQEIFSHCANDYLRNSSIEKMPLAQLFEVLDLATKNEMWPLMRHYELALIKRIDASNVLQILRAALSETTPSKEDPSSLFSAGLGSLSAAGRGAIAAGSIRMMPTTPSTQPSNATLASELKQKLIHLSLARECLAYYLKDWEFCLRRKSSHEIHEIMQCICTVLGTLLM